MQLQQPIDNVDQNLYVGLKAINYVVGWYNLQSQEIHWFYDRESILPFSSQFVISDQPGLYSYTALAGKINAFSDKFSIQLDRSTEK